MFIDFRDSRREREREKHRSEREIAIPLTGDQTCNLVCALTGRRTGNQHVPTVVFEVWGYEWGFMLPEFSDFFPLAIRTY